MCVLTHFLNSIFMQVLNACCRPVLRCSRASWLGPVTTVAKGRACPDCSSTSARPWRARRSRAALWPVYVTAPQPTNLHLTCIFALHFALHAAFHLFAIDLHLPCICPHFALHFVCMLPCMLPCILPLHFALASDLHLTCI